MNSNHPQITPLNSSLKAANPAAFVIAPDQVVAMLIGAEHVTLQGFGGVSQKLPFWVPTVSHFGDVNTEAEICRKRLLVTRLQWGLLGVLCFALSSLAFVAWVSRAPTSSHGAWSIQVVRANGVSVRVGTANTAASVVLSVPVGSMLPNGEMLISVDPVRQSYTTNTHITTVKN